MVILVLACVFNKIRSGLREVETFDNLLGGFVDVRYGSLGSKSSGTAGGWVKVASVSLTTANQTMGLSLEVYGSARQTFSVSLSNSATGANEPLIYQVNMLGDDKVVFSSAKLVTVAQNGLMSNYDLYLKMQSDNTSAVPVAWFLQSVNVGDTIVVTNSDVLPEPANGKLAQIVNGGSIDQKISDLTKAVADMQSRVGAVPVTVQAPAPSPPQAPPPPANPTLNNQPLKWNKQRYLECNGGRCLQNTKVQIWQGNGANGQQWSYNNGNNTITSNGYCLDVANSGTSNGTKVQSHSCNNSNAQKWNWRRDSGGDYSLLSAVSNKCLDVDNGVSANGQQVQIWDCNNSAAQKWSPVAFGQ